MNGSKANSEIAHFPATKEHYSGMMHWVQTQLMRTSFSPQERLKIELALEEALINVVHYAYPQKAGELEIECKYLPKESLTFIIRDQGVPFNPLEQASPKQGQSLEDRKIGGLGIFFLRQNMDEVLYERQAPKNVLTLIKKC